MIVFHRGGTEEEERRADILVRRRMTDRNVYPPLFSSTSVVNPYSSWFRNLGVRGSVSTL